MYARSISLYVVPSIHRCMSITYGVSYCFRHLRRVHSIQTVHRGFSREQLCFSSEHQIKAECTLKIFGPMYMKCKLLCRETLILEPLQQYVVLGFFRLLIQVQAQLNQLGKEIGQSQIGKVVS